ncbi:MAG: RimK family protein [Pseudomonadales bacterium]|jgi:glutathione synthase/RimK-type ligase-like ATP-grasp enzyme|nr:RimK family protein [Pseudomonadales bacterium]
MRRLFVVDKPEDWPLAIPEVEVVGARDYVTDPAWTSIGRARVFNLCRSYRYQSIGYYVSLLAEARGHRPSPTLSTIQDTRSRHLLRLASEDLEELIQQSLGTLQSDEFTLSIYFGRNLAKRHARLALRLYELAAAPLLRARFVRRGERWELVTLGPVAADAIPPEHRAFAVEAATSYFSGHGPRPRRRTPAAYDLAILVDPKEQDPPSNERALARFERAAQKVGFEAERITREDMGRLAEFDALFIRATTAVNHYTYRFAQRARAEGIVVMDDPESILRCTNKVFLSELLTRHRLRQPRTLIVHRRNLDEVVTRLRLPCVLKAPDSAFSRGVHRVESVDAFVILVRELLDHSELIVAQEYLPTDFDWRVGVLDGKPIYVCRYWMASRHWQIVRHKAGGRKDEGNADTLPLDAAPAEAIRTAVRAANLIGRGLYGVDIKEAKGRFYVIEVNDNPSIDAGVEDRVAGNALYEGIMHSFRDRVEAMKRADEH